MQNVNREHALVDLMLQDMQENIGGYTALYIDGERDAVEATKYMMRRLGADMDDPETTREHASNVSDKLMNINYAPPHRAVESLNKMRSMNKRVAVYVSTPMNTDARTLLAGLAKADRLVFVTV